VTRANYFRSRTALRCVSKHEGTRCPILRDGAIRVEDARERALGLPPQDEAAHARTNVAARRRAAFVTPIHLSNSPSRSRGAFLRPGFCLLASPSPDRGVAERRETFGRSGARWACR
jgi:hypothetical protein